MGWCRWCGLRGEREEGRVFVAGRFVEDEVVEGVVLRSLPYQHDFFPSTHYLI